MDSKEKVQQRYKKNINGERKDKIKQEIEKRIKREK